MKIAVMSDVHDNIWKLEAALLQAQPAELLIFCGDFCAPFTLKQIAEGFAHPIHVVFGNNDGDRFLLTRIASKFGHVTLHGEFAHLTLNAYHIAVNHYPEIARPLAQSGQYQAVFYGHDHTHHIETMGACHLINPGEIMGRFGKSTFVIFDTTTGQCQTLEV